MSARVTERDNSFWLGLVAAISAFGTALSILGGLDSLVQLANLSKLVVSHWRDATHAVWHGVATVMGIGIKISPALSRILTVFVLMLVIFWTTPRSELIAFSIDVERAQSDGQKRRAAGGFSTWDFLGLFTPLTWDAVGAASKNAGWSARTGAMLLALLLCAMMPEYFKYVVGSIPDRFSMYGSSPGNVILYIPWLLAMGLPLALIYSVLVRRAGASKLFRMRVWMIVLMVLGIFALSNSADLARDLKSMIGTHLG